MILYVASMMWRIAGTAQNDSDEDDEGETDTNLNALPSGLCCFYYVFG